MTITPNPAGPSSLHGPRRLFGALLAPTRHRARIIWTAAVGILIILVVGLAIRTSQFDLAVVQVLNAHHHGAVGSISNAVYRIFGPGPAIVGTVVLTGIIFAITRNLRVASTFAVTIAATWLSLAIVKLIEHRPRPDVSLLQFPFNPAQIDASYPSGHAAFVTALVITIVLGFAAGRNRWIPGTIGGLLVVGVGTALVIDGVHFPSDVIASIVWAIVVAPLARMVWVSVVLRAVETVRSRPAKSSQRP